MIVKPEAWRPMRAVALGGIAVSVALMVLTGLLRPPAAVPAMDGPGLLPSPGWTLTPDLSVTALLWTAMIVGTLGTAAGLLAVRWGWKPRTRQIMIGALVAVGLLVAVPPMGTTDPMHYAVYGRMAVLGHNPHVLTPAEFRITGDPVGVFAPREWENLPSVYGPVATGAQWAASKLGGESAAWTVLWLKIWNGLAFLAVALCLARLAGTRQARVHLLWTLNPLLLWALIGGAHVDGLSAALAVGALTMAHLAGRRPTGRAALARVATAGALLGAAAAVKLPYALIGVGVFWMLRRSPRALATAAGAAAAVLVATYSMVGTAAIEAVVNRGTLPSWNTPWKLLLPGEGPAPPWLSGAALMLALLVGLVLLRLPSGESSWLRPTLALCLAWVITTPVYYPWYEALVFPLVALAPASRLDWLQLARALVATLGALPGVVFRLGDSWLRAAVFQGPLPSVVSVALLILLLLLLTNALVTPRRRRHLPRPLVPAYGGPVRDLRWTRDRAPAGRSK
ncbi:hypothetical protein [Spirillospora sp. CA-294931]|uniref:hypothetical protein n=1 Tax=Spirillospora sp. CA-294931 TaxID=3240042 RepID=UPI003D935265